LGKLSLNVFFEGHFSSKIAKIGILGTLLDC